MDTVPTDEENGIKVSLPVEKNDCDRCERGYQDIPILQGASNS